MAVATDKFQRNLAGKSTYKCDVCGKNTRDTGRGELGSGLCAFCCEEAGLENSLSDGHITQEQFDEQLAAL